jgi:hypothetical protein
MVALLAAIVFITEFMKHSDKQSSNIKEDFIFTGTIGCQVGIDFVFSKYITL